MMAIVLCLAHDLIPFYIHRHFVVVVVLARESVSILVMALHLCYFVRKKMEFVLGAKFIYITF